MFTNTRNVRILVMALLALTWATIGVSAEVRSGLVYQTNGGLTLGAAYMSPSGAVLDFNAHVLTHTEGASRRHVDRWYITYGREGWIDWRVGVIYSQAAGHNLVNGVWEKSSTKTHVRPLVGVGLTQDLLETLQVRLAADVYGGLNDGVGHRAVVEARMGGFVAGYSWDSDPEHRGYHVGYQFNVP